MMEGIKKVPNGTCFIIENNQIKFENILNLDLQMKRSYKRRYIYNILTIL
ncbi:hypothetical protein Q5M85_21610 [Paraclostridium bifermentans]|nr:hypothetical protein [Paraclostridium bifermentans]